MRRILSLIRTLTVLSLSTGYSQDSSDRCFEVSQMLVKHNKDSLNVISNCDVLDFKIEIYSRWGEVMHTAYNVGKIDIFKQESGTQIQATKRKVKKKAIPVTNPFSEGQYTWIITYFESTDVARKDQKKLNGIIYITE